MKRSAVQFGVFFSLLLFFRLYCFGVFFFFFSFLMFIYISFVRNRCTHHSYTRTKQPNENNTVRSLLFNHFSKLSNVFWLLLISVRYYLLLYAIDIHSMRCTLGPVDNRLKLPSKSRSKCRWTRETKRREKLWLKLYKTHENEHKLIIIPSK